MVDLDPERVESITLLKDAAATAIYGSKAANGVIVIETKAPLPGDLRITYAGNIRLELPDLSGYDLLNAEEKLRVEKMAGYYPEDSDYSYVQIYQQYLREVRRGVNTDWLDIPLRNAVQHRHAVTLEGGDRALRYKLYVGGNFTPGVMKESTRKTQTAALDLSYRFNKLLIRNNITLDNATGDNSPWGSFSEYTRLNPYLRPYGENGEIKKNLQVWQDPKEYWNTDPIPNPCTTPLSTLKTGIPRLLYATSSIWNTILFHPYACRLMLPSPKATERQKYSVLHNTPNLFLRQIPCAAENSSVSKTNLSITI